jgi:hypothetical protein
MREKIIYIYRKRKKENKNMIACQTSVIDAKLAPISSDNLRISIF